MVDHRADPTGEQDRPAMKRQKILARIKEIQEEAAENSLRERHWSLEGGSHPCGVLPWGNIYHQGSAPSIRNSSLGLFRVFDDERLLDVLGFVGASELCKLARCSKAFYILAHTEDLWKALVLTHLGGNFRFEHTWRETYAKEACDVKPNSLSKPRKFEGYYSDVLFQPWLCSSLELDEAW
jgi:hypothetical protein